MCVLFCVSRVRRVACEACACACVSLPSTHPPTASPFSFTAPRFPPELFVANCISFLFMLVECQGGHELQRWRNRCSTLRCDGGCGEPLAIREFRWSCTLCDYDICNTCYEDRVARLQLPVQSALRSARASVSDGDGSAVDVETHEKPIAAKSTPSLNTAAHRLTPITTGLAASTGDPSWVYAPQHLASVKRDLTTFGTSSASIPSKHSCIRPSQLQQSGSASAEGEGEPTNASATKDTMPDLDLVPFGLPMSTLTRMHERRDWLHRLRELELARARRVADGERSAFEVACGVPASAPLTVRQSNESLSAVRSKFEDEAVTLRQAERAEIDTLQAMGLCRSKAHAAYE